MMCRALARIKPGTPQQQTRAIELSKRLALLFRDRNTLYYCSLEMATLLSHYCKVCRSVIKIETALRSRRTLLVSSKRLDQLPNARNSLHTARSKWRRNSIVFHAVRLMSYVTVSFSNIYIKALLSSCRKLTRRKGGPNRPYRQECTGRDGPLRHLVAEKDTTTAFRRLSITLLSTDG